MEPTILKSAPKLRRTLFGKTAMVFCVLSVAVAGAAALLFRGSWETGVYEFLQRAEWGLANEVANQLAEPLSQPPESAASALRSAQEIAYRFQRFNPYISIYVLQRDGSIIASFNPHDPLAFTKIDVAPIERFVAGDRSVLPLLVQDPGAKKPTFVVFSAARISAFGEEGFVLVTLINATYAGMAELVMQQLNAKTAIAGIVIVCLSLTVLGVFLLRNLTRRVSKIAAAVEQYAAGNLAVRVDPGAEDELGMIATGINGMAVRLERHVAELERKDRIRRELIADIWHDLRGPVAAITGNIQLLQESDATAGSSKTKALCQRLHRGTDLLTSLLDGLRELATLEEGSCKPKLATTSCEEIFEAVRLSFEEKSGAYGVALTSRLDSPCPAVICDELMIIRVLSNLVENALRYTERGGSVEMSASVNGDRVRIGVKDSGVGIAESDVPHVFERSYQAEHDGQHQAGVGGLGLAIVKKLVEAHGTMITVQSSAGSGTEFAFTLMRGDMHAPESTDRERTAGDLAAAAES